jgi:RNA polymerase sigma-70 factor (ECF subfamily)
MDTSKDDKTPDQEKLLERLQLGIAGDRNVLAELWDEYTLRLRKLVKLRMDRRLQGRIDPEDVLQESFVDFASRANEYVQDPSMPFYLWLRFLTGQRLQLLHRHHLGAQMRDVGREVSLHRGAMPQATSVSLAAQLLGRFPDCLWRRRGHPYL